MKFIFSLVAVAISTIASGEMYCPMIDGCPIRKGVCVGCIEKPRQVLIQSIPKKTQFSKSLLVTKKPQSETISKKMCVWRCIIPPCDDSMLPKGCRWNYELK